MVSKLGKCPTVLVTGFEPFAGSTLNPSQVIAQTLSAQSRDADDAACSLRCAMLPVDTQRVASVIDSLWREHEPDVVLHFGESARAEHVTLERVAVNLLDFDRPDNAGNQLTDAPIEPAGPTARFVTLPVRSLAMRLEQSGVRTHLSLSAGAYLCNQALYLSLGHDERLGGRTVGFVHVPSLPEQVERGERKGPTMPRTELLTIARQLVGLAVQLHRER